MTLSQALRRQFDNAFGVLAAAIPSFSPSQWAQGSPPFNGPGRAAAHALWCAEFYTCDDWAKCVGLGKKVHEMTDQDVPPQARVLAYLADVRAKTLAWIDAIGDAGLACPWQDGKDANRLERVTYALRHLQHHTGEICAYQKQCGLNPAPWK